MSLTCVKQLPLNPELPSVCMEQVSPDMIRSWTYNLNSITIPEVSNGNFPVIPTLSHPRFHYNSKRNPIPLETVFPSEFHSRLTVDDKHGIQSTGFSVSSGSWLIENLTAPNKVVINRNLKLPTIDVWHFASGKWKWDREAGAIKVEF